MTGLSMRCRTCTLRWWQVSLALGRICPFCGSDDLAIKAAA